ncbi:hypothetical protein J11TS1_36730 [Oceanobacillus sp. J11TS1]|nr:hypothetical protein J11TS1_36730 [Oceanobacillus sp. J11TS1]
MDMALEKEEAEAEHEKAKMYIQYLSNIFAQQQEKPTPEFARARKEFENKLRPKNRKEKGPSEQYEWDFDPNEVIEQQNLLEGR